MLNFSGKKKLPLIRQTESAECGLACLIMIGNYYGHKLDIASLRTKYSSSTRGLNLQSLMDIAPQFHLGARAVSLEMDDLVNLQTPAILHWDMNHFVVLKSIGSKYATIHDPAIGIRKYSYNEMSDKFTGVALEIFPMKEFTRIVEVQSLPLSALWGQLAGVKRGVLQTLILSVILQFLILLSPFYLQLVVDQVILQFDTQLLLILALAFGLVAILNVLTSMMRAWTILYLGNLLSFQMISNVFRHLLYLPVTYFEKRHIGDIISRVQSTKPIQEGLSQGLVSVVIDGLMSIITAIVIFYYSPLLGTLVLASVILMLLATISYFPTLKRLQESAILADAEVNTHEIESIRASTSIKLFNAQERRIQSWRNLFTTSINTNVLYGKHELFNSTIQQLLGGLQTIIVVYFGAKLILNDASTFTVGMLFAFMAYRDNFTRSLTALLEKYIEFRLLSLHLERLADVVLTEREFTDTINYSLPSDEDNKINIEVKNLWFKYSDNDPWVIKDVSFKIENNSFVSITGPSGGGKTTLLKLLLGLYEPTKGEILINGRPLKEIQLENWRDKVGVVMQEDQLLSGNIAQNISFFSEDQQLLKVKDAARRAFIDKEIEKMPMQYLSLIGDTGSSLSGGQKQRVILARALYTNPSLLVLDEGTANLDADTEKKIVDAIDGLEGCTRIIIAHRPYFLEKSDYIITIKDGKLVS